MNVCATPGCGRHYADDHVRCHKCRKQLKALGLCTWCGLVVVGRSAYCEACLGLLAVSPITKQEILPPPPQAAYRGADARENVRETKSGRD